jgi:transposase
MAQALLTDELWSFIEPDLPIHRPSPKGGRPRIDDRAALTGILFVLKTGIPWEYLPWLRQWNELLATLTRKDAGWRLAEYP